MRWRSFHATLTAATLVLASPAMSWAQDIDVFGDLATQPVGTVKPDQGKIDRAKLDKAKADKTPTGSLGHPGVASDSRLAVTPGRPVAAQKIDDPEIDGVTRPATPAPSKDPLDAGGTAKPEAAKPGPSTPETTHDATDSTKPEPGKPAPVVSAASPLETAIKAVLDKRASTDIRGPQAGERRKERAAIEVYYEAHGYAPAWSEDGAQGAAVASVLARLAKAADDALTLPTPPTTLVTTGTPDEVAASDIALTEAVVVYARQATGARVDPAAISPLIGARPELADPSEVVDTIASDGATAGDRLAALNPREPRYAALREKLAALRGAHAVASRPIPPGPTLKIGMRDPRVSLLRARFNIPALDLVDVADEYDMTVAEAVSGFQRSAGVPVTGALDRRTLAALAGGAHAAGQEAPLVANMEMWRWMPRELGRNRIEVDVPAFKVTVFHDGEAVATNRVVVGKTDTPTPIFSNVMKYLIVNPVWNVPQSIIKKEMMAKLDRDGELRGFDVTYKHGQVVVKQPSGAKNALGRIKFMFPNDFSVYLHDTPSKALFSTARRAYSHGCVRVDQPFDFAFSVLNDSVPEGGKVLWSAKRLDSLLGDKERYVNLPRPLPIHIEYFTASVDPDSGRLVQREDIYNYAREVARALGLDSAPAYVAERKPRRSVAKATVADDDADPR